MDKVKGPYDLQSDSLHLSVHITGLKELFEQRLQVLNDPAEICWVNASNGYSEWSTYSASAAFAAWVMALTRSSRSSTDSPGTEEDPRRWTKGA